MMYNSQNKNIFECKSFLVLAWVLAIGLVFSLAWGELSAAPASSLNTPIPLDVDVRNDAQKPILERSVHFSYIGERNANLLDELYYLNGKEPVRVHSTYMARGRIRQPLSHGQQLALVRKTIIEEEVVYQPVASIQLDVTNQHYWIILYPVRNDSGMGLGAFPLRDGEESHPKDSVRVHNLTPYQMRGRLSDEAFELAPREDRVHVYDPESEQHVVFEIYLHIDGRWVRSYMTSRQIRPNRRMNFFTMMQAEATATRQRAVLYTFIDYL